MDDRRKRRVTAAAALAIVSALGIGGTELTTSKKNPGVDRRTNHTRSQTIARQPVQVTATSVIKSPMPLPLEVTISNLVPRYDVLSRSSQYHLTVKGGIVIIYDATRGVGLFSIQFV